MKINRRSVLAMPLLAVVPASLLTEKIPPWKAAPWSTLATVGLEPEDFIEADWLATDKWHKTIAAIQEQWLLNVETRDKPITRVVIQLLQEDQKTPWIDSDPLEVAPFDAFNKSVDMLTYAVFVAAFKYYGTDWAPRSLMTAEFPKLKYFRAIAT